MVDFSLHNLNVNPKFDFIQTLSKHNDEDEANFSFNDSPYDNAILSCVYMSELDFATKFKN